MKNPDVWRLTATTLQIFYVLGGLPAVMEGLHNRPGGYLHTAKCMRTPECRTSSAKPSCAVLTLVHPHLRCLGTSYPLSKLFP